MKASLFAAAILAGSVLSTPASAAAVSMAKDVGASAPSASAELQLVRHGGPSCQLGGRGWHYHTRFGDRIACNPRPRGVFYGWRCEGPRCGWWHRGYRRWH